MVIKQCMQGVQRAVWQRITAEVCPKHGCLARWGGTGGEPCQGPQRHQDQRPVVFQETGSHAQVGCLQLLTDLTSTWTDLVH